MSKKQESPKRRVVDVQLANTPHELQIEVLSNEILSSIFSYFRRDYSLLLVCKRWFQVYSATLMVQQYEEGISEFRNGKFDIECDYDTEKKEWKEEVPVLMRSARSGYLKAQILLGDIYIQNSWWCRDLSLEDAVIWYEMAASHSQHAKNNLAFFKNKEEKIKMLKELAEEGFSKSQQNYGEILFNEHKFTEAREWFEKCANEQIYATWMLAKIYQEGLGLDKPDHSKAIVCLNRAISMGKHKADDTYLRANYQLAKYYQEGIWVKKNIEAAISHLKICAETPIDMFPFDDPPLYAGSISMIRFESAVELCKHYSISSKIDFEAWQLFIKNITPNISKALCYQPKTSVISPEDLLKRMCKTCLSFE